MAQLQLNQEFKDKVITALLEKRETSTASDKMFAKQWNINPSVYSRLKKGERTKILSDHQWLTLGRRLGITLNSRQWNTAKTDVFRIIEEDIIFCQSYSKSRMFVDECGIGKSYTGKYLSMTLQNCFYIDASQAKTKQLFIRLIANTIGIDSNGRFADIMEDVKYYLNYLSKPMMIIDEAGDLDYNAFLALKELWNGTENACGWYLLGAEGLKAKIEKGINNKRVGFAEIFSRYSERYSKIVPKGRQDRETFYTKLIGEVLAVNMEDKTMLNDIIKKCLAVDSSNRIGGLRRAESLLILNQ